MWPVWFLLAHFALPIMMFFPRTLPTAINEDYEDLSLLDAVWNRILSIVVQVGLNWMLTWYGYQ